MNRVNTLQSESMRAFTRKVARHFLEHMDDEMQKKCIDIQVYDGKKARQINEHVIQCLLEKFPGLHNDSKPLFHLFRRWFQLNEFPVAYEDFSTEAYNLMFLERINCLCNWSEQAIKKFHDDVNAGFEKFNYRQNGFSVSNFLKFENNMRELLREVLMQLPPKDQEEIWPIVYEQSIRYQAVVNEFFENLLQKAFAESESLLNNILPKEISAELKREGKVKPVYLPSVTVLFTDFKGFTMLSEKMSPNELVSELDACFSVFDKIIDRFNLEKIKTIGDSFMCAGGLPNVNATHVYDTALAALAMKKEMCLLQQKRKAEGKPFWDVRIGFHTGPVVAGVIGQRKFSYDIWGDTVNTASRMESSGQSGKINVSEQTADILQPFFLLEDRGEISAKNKGVLRMYFLEKLKPMYSTDDFGIEPSEKFLKILDALKSGKKESIEKK